MHNCTQIGTCAYIDNACTWGRQRRSPSTSVPRQQRGFIQNASPPRSEEPKRTGGSSLTTQKKETKISNKGKSSLRRYPSQPILEMMFSIVRQPPMAEFKGMPRCALKKAHVQAALRFAWHFLCSSITVSALQDLSWEICSERSIVVPGRTWHRKTSTQTFMERNGSHPKVAVATGSPSPAVSLQFPKPPPSSPVPQPCVCGINYQIVKQLVISCVSAAIACNGSILEQNDM